MQHCQGHAVVYKQITGQQVQAEVDTGNVTMPAHVHLHVHAQEEHSSKTREAASEQPTDTTVTARSLQHKKTLVKNPVKPQGASVMQLARLGGPGPEGMVLEREMSSPL